MTTKATENRTRGRITGLWPLRAPPALVKHDDFESEVRNLPGVTFYGINQPVRACGLTGLFHRWPRAPYLSNRFSFPYL